MAKSRVVTFAQDRCDRRSLTGQRVGGCCDKETGAYVALSAVENASEGSCQSPESPEWLTDNGSAYRAHETRAFALATGARINDSAKPGKQRHHSRKLP